MSSHIYSNFRALLAWFALALAISFSGGAFATEVADGEIKPIPVIEIGGTLFVISPKDDSSKANVLLEEKQAPFLATWVYSKPNENPGDIVINYRQTPMVSFNETEVVTNGDSESSSLGLIDIENKATVYEAKKVLTNKTVPKVTIFFPKDDPAKLVIQDEAQTIAPIVIPKEKPAEPSIEVMDHKTGTFNINNILHLQKYLLISTTFLLVILLIVFAL